MGVQAEECSRMLGYVGRRLGQRVLRPHVIPLGSIAPRFVRCFSSEKAAALNITESCAVEIKRQCDKAGLSDHSLRVAIKSGGCGGFQYDFTLADERKDNDIVLERDGAKVIVSPSTLSKMLGSTVDYSKALIRSNFVVEDNPQADAACGCGVSFALKMDE